MNELEHHTDQVLQNVDIHAACGLVVEARRLWKLGG